MNLRELVISGNEPRREPRFDEAESSAVYNQWRLHAGRSIPPKYRPRKESVSGYAQDRVHCKLCFVQIWKFDTLGWRNLSRNLFGTISPHFRHEPPSNCLHTCYARHILLKCLAVANRRLIDLSLGMDVDQVEHEV